MVKAHIRTAKKHQRKIVSVLYQRLAWPKCPAVADLHENGIRCALRELRKLPNIPASTTDDLTPLMHCCPPQQPPRMPMPPALQGSARSSVSTFGLC